MEITVIVLWIVSFIFILITLMNIIQRAVKVRRCTSVTKGVISDIKEKVRRQDNYISSIEYISTVTYSVDGIGYERPFTKVYNSGAFTIGQTVEIMYNPKKPGEINRKGKSNKADIIMLGIGVLIGVIGILILVFNSGE